jgi:hypothetical protein
MTASKAARVDSSRSAPIGAVGVERVLGMRQAEYQPDEDERALLDLLPVETVCRDLTAVPPEFRPACGRPGSCVIVRRVPVTIPHALCDLTRVTLSYPGHGGAVTPSPGHGVGNSKGLRVEVDARTLDVTITVRSLGPSPVTGRRQGISA